MTRRKRKKTDPDVVQLADLAEYLKQHGLRVIRISWPAGEMRAWLVEADPEHGGQRALGDLGGKT